MSLGVNIGRIGGCASGNDVNRNLPLGNWRIWKKYRPDNIEQNQGRDQDTKPTKAFMHISRPQQRRMKHEVPPKSGGSSIGNNRTWPAEIALPARLHIVANTSLLNC